MCVVVDDVVVGVGVVGVGAGVCVGIGVGVGAGGQPYGQPTTEWSSRLFRTPGFRATIVVLVFSSQEQICWWPERTPPRYLSRGCVANRHPIVHVAKLFVD